MIRPRGADTRRAIRHGRRWNGGHAAGELHLFRKVRGRWSVAAHLHGEFGGCQFGEY